MGWKEELDNYYNTHETMNDENRQWLREHVVMNAELIKEMDRQQIIATFSDDKRGDEDGSALNHTLLVRTLVWQSLGLILAKQADPLNQNVRAFWYEISDPIYSNNDLYTDVRLHRTDPHHRAVNQLLELEEARETPRRRDRQLKVKRRYVEALGDDCLVDFVTERIFRYQGPFQFEDSNAQYRLPGEGPASLVFFVEKQGLWDKYCVDYYNEHRISVLASKGFPSYVTLEYFADQLHARKIKNVALAGLVDYDPAGYDIFDDYISKFQFYGFGIKNATRLTELDLFTQKALDTKFDDLEKVKPNKEKQTQAWFEKTGGIDGKRRGIHVNHAMKGRVDKKVDAWIKEQLSKSLEEVPHLG